MTGKKRRLDLDEKFKKLRRLVVLVKRHRKRHRGEVRQGYPDEIRELARELLACQAYNTVEIRSATGLSFGALKNWGKGRGKVRARRGRRLRQPRREKFSPVALLETVPEGEEGACPAAPARSRYSLSGPGGMKLSDMSLEEIADLWRHLDRSAIRRPGE